MIKHINLYLVGINGTIFIYKFILTCYIVVIINVKYQLVKYNSFRNVRPIYGSKVIHLFFKYWHLQIESVTGFNNVVVKSDYDENFAPIVDFSNILVAQPSANSAELVMWMIVAI